MNKYINLVVGSQDLYGDDVLVAVEKNGRAIADFLNKSISGVDIKYFSTVKNSEQIFDMAKESNYDDNCIGVIVWCHTFSPSKMWIKGLKELNKPLLHLHTQANEKLPYDAIDMDFMNLNQAAHGDREFGYICARLKLDNTVIAGFYKNKSVIDKIQSWTRVAIGYDFSNSLKVVRFGDNMREVAVTEGSKVGAQIQFGWQVNTIAVGDLVEEINLVKSEEVDVLMKEYNKLYVMKSSDKDSIYEQAKYEKAMENILNRVGGRAFTNNFQDLHGMKQLPGLATQRLMACGIGYGGEGDWKTSALDSVMMKMAEGQKGSTGFMEDYTYNLEEGSELVLGAHMLEVPVSFASTKPEIKVFPLGIGGKEPPARLVFDGVSGDGIAVTIVEMEYGFKMIVAKIELVKRPKAMPNLPIGGVMWKIKPSLQEGAMRWIEEGGAHHTVVSTAVSVEQMQTLAKMWKIPCVVID